MKHIGDVIKSTIIPKSMTQAEAADKLGVTRPALSRVLNGHSKLSDNMAAKLEKVFGADANHLLATQRELLEPEIAKVTSGVRSYSTRYCDISADDISEYFARKKIGRDEFPQFVRMLVQLENPTLSQCDFHARDNAERKGWDGVTKASEPSPHVPSGHAIWELGTSEDPKQKAEEDYNKSLSKKNSLTSAERAQTTYVFVTPHNWPNAKNWAKGKATLEDYKEVLAFDASDLEQWLELQPTAQVWLAECLGISTQGLYSLEQTWHRWASVADPNISPLIFKKSLEACTEDLKRWFNNLEPKIFSIQGTKRDEVGAFLGAAWNLKSDLRSFLAKCVVISPQADLVRLAASCPNLIPIALDAETVQECVRVFRNRPIIAARDSSMRGSDEPSLVIDLPNFDAFDEAIKAMGISRSQKEQLEASTNRSPTILRRILAKLPEDRQPPWSKYLSSLTDLIPAFLAGTWQKYKDDDLAFVEALGERCGIQTYNEIETTIAKLAQLEDAPTWLESDYRGVTSKLDCLYVLGPFISPEILDSFLELAELILSEYDPALDLDEDQRWAASLYKKTRKSSNALRGSVAETLVILATHGGAHLQSCSNSIIQNKIDGLISRLLADNSAGNWLSQNGLLRVYAEAAPTAFLEAVSRELRASTSVFDVMFRPAPMDSYMSSPNRTDVLWALESLAWSPEYVYEACYALADLCRYPCNDNWANKPFNSLQDILLVWRPHTCLTVEDRIDLLRNISKRHHEIGWQLACNTLDPYPSTTTGTCRPKWRDWACGDRERVTYGEIWKYADACREIVLSYTSYNSKKLDSLLRIVNEFPPEDHPRVVDIFSHWKTCASRDEIISVREKVRIHTRTRRAVRRRKKTQENKKHEGFDGSKILEILEPQGLLEQHAWLFLDRYIEESVEELSDEEELDFKVREQRIESARTAAMQEIWQQFGFKGVVELLELSKDCSIVGWYLAAIELSPNDLSDVVVRLYQKAINHEDDKHRLALVGLLANRREQVSTLLESVKLLAQERQVAFDEVALCTLMDFRKPTLDLVDSLAPASRKKYWATVRPGYVSEREMDPNHLVHQLLEVERPFTAFNAVRLSSKHLESHTLAKLLMSIATFKGEIVPSEKLDGYRLSEMIEDLRSREAIGEAEMLNLEMAFVSVLTDRGNKGGIPTISRFLAKEPYSFFQMIAAVYCREDRQNDSEQLGLPLDEEAAKNFGHRAYEILTNISVLPGSLESEQHKRIGSAIQWVHNVNEYAIKYDRRKITSLKIGELFATSQLGEDGIWPNEITRAVLEEFQDSEMANGLCIAKRNQRGVTVRPTPDSGDQERKIAETYFHHAEKLAKNFPYVAKVLRGLGKDYEREGEMHDRDGRLSKRMSH